MKPRSEASGVELAIPLKPLDAEPGHFSLFAWQNLTIATWASEATGPAVHRIDVAAAPLLKERAEGVTSIHLVKEGAGMPTAEARDGFLQSMKVNARSLQCVSVVLLGGGFWASTLQSIVTGMRMLAPNTFTMRVDNGFDAVVHWLPPEHLRRTGVPLRPNDLKAAMIQAFSRTMEDAERLHAVEPGEITATHRRR
jgi:hypothetical protein